MGVRGGWLKGGSSGFGGFEKIMLAMMEGILAMMEGMLAMMEVILAMMEGMLEL